MVWPSCSRQRPTRTGGGCGADVARAHPRPPTAASTGVGRSRGEGGCPPPPRVASVGTAAVWGLEGPHTIFGVLFRWARCHCAHARAHAAHPCGGDHGGRAQRGGTRPL
ncbi:hypothetical protein BU14_0461s0009 [Porphyra umbilicalis]|uniref:Uncharacterized protein n=1 Tax=Porphyra umbilicalis TaxID=2786 RepID=A0A1X6NU85_PORUM|nr:hypothetical protein BU14_0461s0009 [Porphyra umbilicalis]|eukprot:OSX72168.1 hypothetical protein BU14_0461s0009 [Porphyra umbilicalis]